MPIFHQERKTEIMENEKGNKENCSHHWIIKTPVNGISTGKCKLCKEKKDFNSGDSDWKGYDWRKRQFKLGKKKEN